MLGIDSESDKIAKPLKTLIGRYLRKKTNPSDFKSEMRLLCKGTLLQERVD
jgi:hypothetical protein